ncbi:MAG TPA: hypothetical protein VHX19_22140, partial [Stellaceae bacterium]|nr:hypothetical protein [Stellaceae bacterium]
PNADVIIVASALHDRLVKEGLLTDTTQLALGRSEIGMAVSAKAKKQHPSEIKRHSSPSYAR